MLWDQGLTDLFLKGGFAMWPLLFCSVMALAIIAERSHFYFKNRMDQESFKSEIKNRIESGRLKEAVTFSRKFKHPLSKISEFYLMNLRSDAQRDNVLKREGSLILEQAEKHLKGLAAITHAAPLLGLLGTVTGLVSAFHKIELLGGQSQPADLASGIWEALITTVFGLVIAIPAMAFFHYFEDKADQISRRMQFLISELDELFGKKTAAGFKTQDIELIEKEGATVS
jgi:biopolymer transport protein ExbB